VKLKKLKRYKYPLGALEKLLLSKAAECKEAVDVHENFFKCPDNNYIYDKEQNLFWDPSSNYVDIDFDSAKAKSPCTEWLALTNISELQTLYAAGLRKMTLGKIGITLTDYGLWAGDTKDPPNIKDDCLTEVPSSCMGSRGVFFDFNRAVVVRGSRW